ncbi:MAG TPA: hypothetical protein VFP32_03585 [Candidatus Saccharimonadales bacterium]|nr:hypothetical protein [Candidatus Saccharimonadales bacterium]
MENPQGQPSPNLTPPGPLGMPPENPTQPPLMPQPISTSSQPIYPQMPAYAPAQPIPPAAPTAPAASAGNIILQWLTYAFWGWTVLAMSFLTASVLASFMADADTAGFMPYTIAAVLVLLPISIACDHFYRKQEPDKKTGAASIVMVIHAVIFALFCIASLIAAVFSLVTMFTSSSDSSGKTVALLSSIIIFFLYAATFLRTIAPPRFPMIRRYFVGFMVVVVGIISILGFVGPVAKARETRNDKLIEDNISSLETSINSYAESNNQLPSSLDTLSLNGDTSKLVTDKLVEYKPNTRPAATTNYDTGYSASFSGVKQSYTYYYQLCVTYKKASKDQAPLYSDSLSDDGYSSYISAYYHGAGNTCYKLKTNGY